MVNSNKELKEKYRCENFKKFYWLLTDMKNGYTNCQVGNSNAYQYKHFNNFGHPKERWMFIANNLRGRNLKKKTEQVRFL